MNMVLFLLYIFSHLSQIILQLLQVDIVPFQKVMSNVLLECTHTSSSCAIFMLILNATVTVAFFCRPCFALVFYLNFTKFNQCFRMIRTKARSVATHQSMSWECLCKSNMKLNCKTTKQPKDHILSRVHFFAVWNVFFIHWKWAQLHLFPSNIWANVYNKQNGEEKPAMVW